MIPRRRVLQTGVATSVTAPLLAGAVRPQASAVIQILLVGGPSQIDTFDPKPDAPSNVRGPFGAISTRIPSVCVSELFPKIASIADRLCFLRSVHHDGPPIHEVGLQLVQTGYSLAHGEAKPHLGELAERLLPPRSNIPAWVVLPEALGDTGTDWPSGQDLWKQRRNSPAVIEAIRNAADHRDERPAVRSAYESTDLGSRLLTARRLVEAGVRVVTVNAFATVFGQETWDVHAANPRLPTTFESYRSTIAPEFDGGFSALITDLAASGLLSEVMVIASGEFGRTPTINETGGRDHWPAAWTALCAGAGMHAGALIGATNRYGEIADHPAHARELTAMPLKALGLVHE